MKLRREISALLVSAVFCISLVPMAVYGGNFTLFSEETGRSAESAILADDSKEMSSASPSPSPSASPSARPSARPSPTRKPSSDSTATADPKPMSSPDITPAPSPDVTTLPEPEETPAPSPDVTTLPEPEETPSPSPDVTTLPEPEETLSPSPDVTTLPEPEETPTSSPDDDDNTNSIVYEDGIATVYVENPKDFILAEMLGLNVIAGRNMPNMSKAYKIFGDYNTKSDPYMKNKTFVEVDSADDVNPNVIFGRNAASAASDTEEMIEILDNYNSSVKDNIAGQGLKGRYMTKGGEMVYGIAEDAEDYYHAVQTFALAKLLERSYDKRYVAIINPDTMKAYGVGSGMKAAEYFEHICYNLVKSGTDTLSADQLEKADIIVTAGVGNYSESQVKDKLRSNGMSEDFVNSVKILTKYPSGIFGMDNHSPESLAGFAYSAGFAYYDIIPDDIFNPVAMCAYFYKHFLNVKDSDLAECMELVMDGASLPDGVEISNIDMNNIGKIIDVGVQYYEDYIWDFPTVEVLYGDVYEDNKINMKDAVALLQYVYNINNNINIKNADCYNDGEITLADWQILFPYIYESETITELPIMP